MKITKDDRSIIIPDRMSIYAGDITRDFDSFWNAIQTDSDTLDFTTPAQHNMVGWPWPVWLPSYSESITTLSTYLDHANLTPGAIVIDAGGFAGITSMLAANIVGHSGLVITLEPDPINAFCAERNFDQYRETNGWAPDLRNIALWDKNDTIQFTSDAAMGSAAREYIGDRGDVHPVTAESLLTVAAGLPSVDWLKLDIEGAETRALSDTEFFANYMPPRVTVECHVVNGTPTTGAVCQLLEGYGYTVQVKWQKESPFMLVEATA